MRSNDEMLDFVQNLILVDKNAWKDFMREFHPIMEGYLEKRANNLDRENILSNFYLKLVEEDYIRLKNFSYGGQMGFVNYLYSILQNEIGTESKKKHYKLYDNAYDPESQMLNETLFPPTEPIPLPEEIEIFDGITEEIFLDAVMQLSNLGEREAIYLYYRGHTNQEIADIMKKPINTVLSWNKRSKEKLKKILDKYRGVQ